MKTIYLTSIVLLLVYSNNTAQDWEHYYGQDNVYNIEKDIQEAYDKGYLQLGRIYYEDNDNWISQAWLIKTDINGNLLWDKVLVNTENLTHGLAIEQTSDGGSLICGSIRFNATVSYPFIVKLNACGEKEWCRRIPGALNSLPWAEDVKELPNGDIIILVNMYGNNPNETMHLFKFDANGSMLWQQAYCSGYEYEASAIPFGESITLISGNRIIISGEVYWEHPWEPGSGDKWLRPLFVMVDSIGNEEWVLPFGLQDTIIGTAENVYYRFPNEFIGIAKKYPIPTMQSMLIKIDSLGNVNDHVVLENNLISPNLTRGVPLHITEIDSLYVIGGIYGDPDDGYAGEFTLDTNIFSSGFELGNFVHHINKDEPYSMEKTMNNRLLSSSTFKEPYDWDIYLTKLNSDLEQDSIYTGSYTYDSLCPEPILSGFITLNDCFMTDIGEIPTPKEYYGHIASIPMKVYPNPASNIINFALENTQYHSNIKLQIFDTSGKLIGEQPIAAGSEEASTDVSFWQSGMYAVVVLSGGKVVGRGKFVVQ